MSPTPSSRALGVLVIIVCTPLAVAFGSLAALFLLQEFVNGWIPSRWFSDSPLDWMMSTGTEGGAANYIGFMLTAMPAGLTGKGALWGYEKVTGKSL